MPPTPDPFTGQPQPPDRGPIDQGPPIDIGDPYPPDQPGDPGVPIDGGDTIVIQPGSSPPTYEYDIVALYSGIGSAYAAVNGSHLTCNSSVAVFNRNNAFSAVNSSEAVLSNCCSYCANQGFVAWEGSSINGSLCVASISGHNYWMNGSSSMNLRQCASVFPVYNGVYAMGSSSFVSSQFESMTAVWGAVSESTQIPVPVHFNSRQNSFCTNSSIALSSRQSLGLSGPVISASPISFLWSQIYRSSTGLPYPPLSVGNPFDNTQASYRFVPKNHSTDYNALYSTATSVVTTVDAKALVLLLSQSRQAYTSVKPPAWLFSPEDGSGNTDFGAASINSFSLSTVLGSLV